MSGKHTLIKGTFLLTAAGLLSRFMGFFYHIFLSRSFGEENVGLYHLIFPVYTLCLSFSCSGIETAISRTVARKLSLHQKKEAKETLLAGLLFSLLLSLTVTFFLFHTADFIAIRFLKERRCIPLLRILAFVIPFSAIHSCVCGYCLGLHRAKFPAVSQLAEQTARISSVLFFYFQGLHTGTSVSIAAAAAGLLVGEFVASICSFLYLSRSFKAAPSRTCCPVLTDRTSQRSADFRNCQSCNFPQQRRKLRKPTVLLVRLRELLHLSVPLTFQRISLNLLQTAEAAFIPARLRLCAFTTSEALSIYGVLTGMALPLILFPSAITNSVALMLLPAIAKTQASETPDRLAALIRKAIFFCFFLGCCSGLFFLLFGRWLGSFLFHSTQAGRFITTLSWICPFLYSGSSLLGVLNGLGKTSVSFRIHMISLSFRIAGAFLAIPLWGIQGYLWGLLFSQLSLFFSALFYIRRLLRAPSV